jgi:DNA polymerase elongation subunit (family B)
VAVSGEGGEVVLDGDEPSLLRHLDAHLAALPAGTIATWNGSAFDLPFLAHRAALAGVPLGLRPSPGPASCAVQPLPGHAGAYRATWHGHTHVDGYRLYRADVGRALPVSCALKSIARLVGLPSVEVDASRVHELATHELYAYVASDARLARLLVARRADIRPPIPMVTLVPAAPTPVSA